MTSVRWQFLSSKETTSRESSSRLLWRQAGGIAMQLQKQRRMDVVLVIMTSFIWQCYSSYNGALMKFSFIKTSVRWKCFVTLQTMIILCNYRNSVARQLLWRQSDDNSFQPKKQRRVNEVLVYYDVSQMTMLCNYRNNIAQCSSRWRHSDDKALQLSKQRNVNVVHACHDIIQITMLCNYTNNVSWKKFSLIVTSMDTNALQLLEQCRVNAAHVYMDIRHMQCYAT